MERCIPAGTTHIPDDGESASEDHAIVRTAMNAPKSPLPTSNLLILGNGDRSIEALNSPALTFRFNGRSDTLQLQGQVDVQMTRDTLGAYRLTLKSPDQSIETSALEEELNRALDAQTRTLGCLPSTGYALIHGLWSTHENATVAGMWFNPCLSRPTNLPPRKPLPQAFHNWLGERRTTFLRWLIAPPKAWSWPLTNDTNFHSSSARPEVDSLVISAEDLLDRLDESARSGCLQSLEATVGANIQPSAALLEPSDHNTRLERRFHLNRLQSDTPNWWLFDAQASSIIEQIACQLRVAQQQVFILAKAARGMAD